MPKPRARFVALTDLLAHRRIDATVADIEEGRVIVDGRVLSNPRARVRSDASVRVVVERRLRGDLKLSFALESFGVSVAGRVAVDVGASTGGFTTALLRRGAHRVYAVDAGVGQLSGRLRADTRVVNLERRNLGDISSTDIAGPVDVITADLSYLAIAEAVPQLERFVIAPDADLVVLVKPTFELRLNAPTDDPIILARAVERARSAISDGPWRVIAIIQSAITGSSGTIEYFIHAVRAD